MTDSRQDIIALITAALPDVLAIYLFGTHASDFERSDSDIDVAVLGSRPLDSVMVWELSQQLATKLKREVDLVDLATASTVLKAQIVVHGERIWCGAVAHCEQYEVYVLSAYARLNEERKYILDDVLSRGSVYG